MHRRADIRTLSVAVDGDAPPSAFLIFRPGVNGSTKGPTLFDEPAAESVLRAYAEHGPEVMIDLEHLSIGTESKNYDPDARGWCRLELRDDGSLWAVDVRWTPDGVKRLHEKRQRFISPCFEFDPKTKRVVALINIALTALPATHQLVPLVAANVVAALSGGGTDMLNPEDLKKAIQAIKDGDGEGALAVLEAMVVEAASGEAPALEEESPLDIAAEAATPGEKKDEDEEEKTAAVMAASVRLFSLTGKRTHSEAVCEVERWKASHLELEDGRKKLAAERAALESGERRSLVADLVKFGAEIPATAWADPMKPGKPCKRLQDEPIGELRDRVKKLSAARGPAPLSPKPPSGDDLGLSERERALCTRKGLDPAKYAETKRGIAARSGRPAAHGS